MNKLGTKAETLKILYKQLKNAEILPQFSFTVADWNRKRAELTGTFSGLEWNGNVIVRSSSLNEDTQSTSQAGKFESIGNVHGIPAFENAVERVILSYDDDNGANQVLVQPMLESVKLCGVAFTLEPSTLGNYYVVNYDETGSTSAITSGNGKQAYLYYQFKDADLKVCPRKLKGLIETLKELEEFFDQDNLDVEFALTEDGTLYILQVRALCVPEKRIDRKRQATELERIVGKIKKNRERKPFLRGEKAIGTILYQKLQEEYPNTVLFDGDVLRQVFGNINAEENEEEFLRAYKYVQSRLNERCIDSFWENFVHNEDSLRI